MSKTYTNEIKILIEDYKRRLKTITDERPVGYDAVRTNRLRVKAGCFRTFIAELERIADKAPIEESKCDTLNDYIVTEQSIQCEICEKEDYVFDIDLPSACDHFYGNGWRIIDGTKYCSNCATKHINDLM